MTSPENHQGQPQGDEAPAPSNQQRPANRTASRRRWIKAAGLAAVPLIITVRAQPAFAKPGPKASKKSQY